MTVFDNKKVYQVISEEAVFAEVRQALDWVDGIRNILDVSLPTAEEPGLGNVAVALDLAHHLGSLADTTDLSPWMMQFREDLLDLSERC